MLISEDFIKKGLLNFAKKNRVAIGSSEFVVAI